MARNKNTKGLGELNKVTVLSHLADLRSLVTYKEEQHSALCQMDMLSGIGSNLRKEINMLKGEIKGIEWILSITK